MSTEVLHKLNSLGWEWRENGAIVTVGVDNRKIQVFVPLQKLWDIFNSHMVQHVGCPLALGIGDPFTVGGFFKSLGHAFSSAAKGVAHAASAVSKATGLTAITKAATKVVSVATNFAKSAVNATLGKIPVIGPLAKSAVSIMNAPANLVTAIASGERIDKAVLNNLKQALKDVKQIAPYAQMIISLVPGVGTGISAALGASLALASGQNITEALKAGVMSAIPGGPLVQAAAGLAADALQGKNIAQSVLNNLPISPAARTALVQGLQAAQKIAKGQNVGTALLDAGLKQLPPQFQKAVQIGVALGHAKSLQDAATSAVSAASELSSQFKVGQVATAALKALPPGIPHPPQLLQAIAKANDARASMARVVSAAQTGNAAAQQIVAAIKNPLPDVPHLARVGAPVQFVPYYIGAPLAHHRRGRGNVHIKPVQMFNQHPSFSQHPSYRPPVPNFRTFARPAFAHYAA